ncbi:gliding motility-associated C-terminal domain-containing protein [Flavobacterium sp.]|uniref:T9SS type B sorting domain-containing protein n=1 Tax=Flavobacterium sp. TaxID=239 RepID=UPI0025C1D097|nr:gliding motility-associated C-terminal domain-containing protein [Flavobacterium sp.]
MVDACGPQEGLNEMVRFKVGATAVNTSNLSVDWPNNNWQGLIQNAVTNQKVATLNADILDAGGCGQLIQPTGGVLPANARVILVTSHLFDTALNQFGPITEDIYILFQNNTNVTSGHFANSGTGLRTLEISFGSCSDSVTYDRELLIDENGVTTAGDGATVEFTAAGVATYTNYGCSAPVPPFTVQAGSNLNACAGSTISLVGQAQGQQSVSWGAASGSFSSGSALTTNYTIPANATGSVVLTLSATNTCGAVISDTVTITITSAITPNFATTLTLCQNATAPVLATTSPNGIVGTWNPSAINNTASATYVFTPTANQCASPITLSVTVTNSIVPDFATTLTLCQNATAPVLATTSPNGIVGTWNPSTINNTASGTYIFTPTANQCAAPITLSVTVTNSIVPDFATTLTLCQNATAPVLATTSPNGIVGTWNPSAINNTASGTYVFTPNANQCASPITLSVTITNSIVPDFAPTLTLCQNATAPVLATTSPNGIIGTWNPSTINNTASATYIFTPNANQCAAPITLSVTVTNSIVPDFATTLTLCQNATAPVLATTSPNGISGTWNPSAINNTVSGTYIFTPTANQCAAPITLSVTITNSIVPDFAPTLTLCQNATAPVLATTSPNGIIGTWNPSAINNTASATYIFTPTANQCASPITLSVTITNSIVPDFATTLTLCQNAAAPVLATTSPNGITGTWNPSTIDNQNNATYEFTPDAGQCAQNVTLTVAVGILSFEIEGNCQNGDFVLLPTSLTLGAQNVSYEWTDASGAVVGQEETLNITDLVNGTNAEFPMQFTLTVELASGCSAFRNYTVESIFCTVPKGVSANGDGLNDSFDLTGLNVKELKIYNRFGAEVYSRRDYTNQWVGQSSNGNELPDATYFYVMTTTDGKSRTGWVYLIRRS